MPRIDNKQSDTTRGGIVFPRFFIQLAAAALSGGLLAVSFPAPGVSWAAWFALTPLLLAARKASVAPGFLYGFTSGVIYFAVTFSWMFHVAGYRVLHHAILHTYLGCYVGIFAFLYGLIGRKSGDVTALLTAPLIWIVLEYIRSNLGFLSYPSTLLGHSQYQEISVSQIAAFTGVYGVSFLIVLVNTGWIALGFLASTRFYSRTPHRIPKVSNRGMASIFAISALALAAAIGFSLWVTRQEIKGTPVKVAVIQGNIGQGQKWDPRYAGRIMKTYESLSLEAAGESPQLIIWPESATPRSINQDGRIMKRVQNIADATGAFLLLGSSYAQKFKELEQTELGYHNSAFLIAPHKFQEVQRYDKIRLLPFGEYLPYPQRIPWQWISIPPLEGFKPGTDFTVFNIGKVRFAVNICWETIFSDLTREFVKRGAQFIVNLSNEAWFGKSAAPYQFLSISVFRAIENGVFVIRSANTGVSCIIDPYGRILQRVEDESGTDIFVEGWITGHIIPIESKTLYSRAGDWWVALSAIGALWAILSSLFRKTGRPSPLPRD